ncbi:(2Fe-2S)-binding protein [Nitrosomonas sp. JL21]|uniref:(2Fe-2S)-binding protein n=1 Tax=Nitrosomonas sp. JL21 TaxID=153949 RepID=UPI00136C6B6E|nr:(2Fe-2S)-binding protein [Nitrosomonas sp. JL21]MBL8497485.1 (2Fe-2S)-binding protein [Nitrosomonas sp.]MCC7090938.1 (2Fe-2S)-binding protein [Nitrosomonas sp.]MXS78919.1 (2Fe-2S)-binding protein [Nitrosomonas sp. JL21]
MYVCICKGVTENTLRAAIYQGADRMRDLKACLGVTGQCGLCACHAKQILDETLSERTPMQKRELHSAEMCETAA